MDIIQVDQETCNQCGICALGCGRGLIDFQINSYPKPIALAESQCIKCGHCVAVCPTASLTHRDMPVKDCPPVKKELQLTAEQCEHFITSRRSIRAYENKPVLRAIITHLIEIARYAPTGHNSQNVEWLVIDDKDELSYLQKIGIDWMRWMISDQPEVALALGMQRMLKREENGENVLLRAAPVIIIAHADKKDSSATLNCTIALSYLELASRSVDLGCCWAGHLYHMASSYSPMQEALALPEGNTTYGCLMMGYPKLTYHRIPLRPPPRITWH